MLSSQDPSIQIPVMRNHVALEIDKLMRLSKFVEPPKTTKILWDGAKCSGSVFFPSWDLRATIWVHIPLVSKRCDWLARDPRPLHKKRSQIAHYLIYPRPLCAHTMGSSQLRFCQRDQEHFKSEDDVHTCVFQLVLNHCSFRIETPNTILLINL